MHPVSLCQSLVETNVGLETYVVASEHTVQELQCSDHQQEYQEDINELCALGRRINVIVVNVL